jgi:hypothetical protein
MDILSTKASSGPFRERIQGYFAFLLLVSEKPFWDELLGVRKVVLVKMDAEVLCSNGGLFIG